MLSRNRLYTRKEPDKDARLFVIFSEGEKREPNYFNYFNGITSQIKIEMVPLVAGNNSPMGLYTAASLLLIPTIANPSPKYDLQAGDEVWFVIDTDQWGADITALRTAVANHSGWQIAQSNPCFEVWLHFHFSDAPAQFPDMGIPANWKGFVHATHGGFHASKHPIFIERATENARNNYGGQPAMPGVGDTEVFLLAEKILPLVKVELDAALGLI
jgi:hypothetical protein